MEVRGELMGTGSLPPPERFRGLEPEASGMATTPFWGELSCWPLFLYFSMFRFFTENNFRTKGKVIKWLSFWTNRIWNAVRERTTHPRDHALQRRAGVPKHAKGNYVSKGFVC